MRAKLTVPALSLVLTGCFPLASDSEPGDDTCGASAYAYLVGADVTAIDGITVDGPVRALRPGEAVTLEYLGERMNFALDAQDRIVRVYCG